MKLTKEDVQRFLDSTGKILPRKVRRSISSRRARREGTKSRIVRMSGKVRLRAGYLAKQKYNAIKAALMG